MSEDFKREDVVDLAEKIFVKRIYLGGQSDNDIEKQAKEAFKSAMMFRKIEKEIFEGKI